MTSTESATEPRGLAAARANLVVVWANRNVRRIQGAFIVSETGDWAYAMAILVWAYDTGGATLVGAWAGVRMLLAAVAAPIGGAVADRMSRRTFMLLNDGIRLLLSLVTAAAILFGLGLWAVLVPPTLLSLVGASFRAAQAGLLPSLVDNPKQLTSANATAEMIDSTAGFVGPALSGFLLAILGIVPVVVINAATFGWSLLLVSGVKPTRTPSPRPAADSGGADGDDEPKESFLVEMSGGFRTIAADRDLLAAAGLMGINGVLAGVLQVVVVLMAAESLGDPSAVGWMMALLGAATFLGGIVMLALAGRVRLGRLMAIGVLGWCIPIGLLGLLPDIVFVVAAMVVIGLLDPLINAGFGTVPSRLVEDRLLSRVFAAIESLFIGTAAFGAFITPIVVGQLGLGPGLALLGGAATVVTLVCATRMPHLDGRLATPRGLDLLGAVPLFQPLMPTVLEQIARKLEPVDVAPGEVVVAEGDVSDRFYVIESGTVEVSRAGEALRTEGRGDVFGEIGLLRDVARTATVTAVDAVGLLALARDDFLGLLAGDDQVSRLVDDLASRRLAL